MTSAARASGSSTLLFPLVPACSRLLARSGSAIEFSGLRPSHAPGVGRSSGSDEAREVSKAAPPVRPVARRASRVSSSAPVESLALGVGRSVGIVLESVRCAIHFRPGSHSRWCGSSGSRCSRSSSTNSSVGVDSCADGVGSRWEGCDAEPAETSVRRAHVGSSDAVVRPPIAEVGQVGENDSESRFSWSSVQRPRGRPDGVDVLEDDEGGT